MAPNMDKDYWKRQNIVKKDGIWTVDGRPNVTVQPSEYRQPSNMPGKTWLTLIVTSPPNGSTPPHNHNQATVIATVIKGRVLNQMIHPSDPNGEPGNCTEHDSGPKIYEVGESWYEAPGCHHVRSENAGEDGEDAVFVANLVIDSKRLEGEGDIASKVVIIDAEVEERERQKK